MIDKGSVGAQLSLGEGWRVGKVSLGESFLRAGRHSVWLPAGVVKVPSLPASLPPPHSCVVFPQGGFGRRGPAGAKVKPLRRRLLDVISV